MSLLDSIYKSQGYKRFMKSLVLYVAIAAIIGIILWLTGKGATMLIVGMSSLAVLALIALPGLSRSSEESGHEKYHGLWRFITLLAGMSLFVFIIGLLFVMLHWHGGRIMFYAGSVGVVCSALAFFYYRSLKNKIK